MQLRNRSYIGRFEQGGWMGGCRGGNKMVSSGEYDVIGPGTLSTSYEPLGTRNQGVIVYIHAW